MTYTCSEMEESVGLLTLHVEFDGGGDGHGDVVVGRLAGEDGVQVAPLQAPHHELVAHLFSKW